MDQSAEGGLLSIGNTKKAREILRKAANDRRKLPIILNTTGRHGAPKNSPLGLLFYRVDQFYVVIATGSEITSYAVFRIPRALRRF